MLEGLGSKACDVVYDWGKVCRPIEANVGEAGGVSLGDTFHTCRRETDKFCIATRSCLELWSYCELPLCSPLNELLHLFSHYFLLIPRLWPLTWFQEPKSISRPFWEWMLVEADVSSTLLEFSSAEDSLTLFRHVPRCQSKVVVRGSCALQ